jgi:hypothetical protein
MSEGIYFINGMELIFVICLIMLICLTQNVISDVKRDFTAQRPSTNFSDMADNDKAGVK